MESGSGGLTLVAGTSGTGLRVPPAPLEECLKERLNALDERTRELETRSSELEEANARLESFSYSVSHDLRAPLRAISGFSQILARRHRKELSEEGQHYLDNIVEASSHMGRLIDDLLTYSRLGRSAIELTPLSLNDVLTQVLRDLAPEARDTPYKLTIDPELPWVTGHHTLLVQTFSNLLENALTYTKPGEAANVFVSWTERGSCIEVSVRDEGIGISPEHFQSIFHPFQRLHSFDAYPGTGIGLAVVKRAMELQRGTVRVESTPGAGSTFHVLMPRAGIPK